MALSDRTKARSATDILAEAVAKVSTGLRPFSTRTAPETIVEHTLAIQPMPHQLVVAEAVKAGHTRLLIADDMGVGKTYSALLALDELNAYPALIVCPPALVINWERSIKTALPHRSVSRISGQKPTSVPNTDIVICPDSVIQYWALAPVAEVNSWARANQGKTREQRTLKPVNILAKHPWAGLVQDEAHRSKSEDSGRSKAMVTIAKHLNPEAPVLLLSGTPLLSRPVELIPLLNILGHLPRFGGASRFKTRYCDPVFNGFGTTFNGATNVKELNEQLTQWVMIRRKREDVIILPEFSRYITPVALTGKAVTDYKRAVRDLEEFLQEKRDDDKFSLNDRAHAIVLLGQLRQIAGLGKVSTAVDATVSLLDEGEQVFLVTAHKEVAWKLRESLIAEGIDARTIVSVTGDDSGKQKQDAVDKWQAGTARVLIGNIQAVSEGLTMTSGATMITVELPWTPSALKQAEARLHRYGQTRPCTNNILVSALDGDSSVDERLWGMLEGKAGVVGAILDDSAETLVGGSTANELLDSYR